MTDGDARRASARAAESQADTASRREQREKGFEPFRKFEAIAGGFGNAAKGISSLISKGSKAGNRNHPQWYLKFEDAKYWGSRSFRYPTGRMQAPGVPNGGLMVINYLPSLGGTLRAEAVNRALLALQQKVRQSNSGAKNYEPSDIAIYVLATNEILASYAELARIYKLLNYVDPDNLVLKKNLIEGFTNETYEAVAAQAEKIYFALNKSFEFMKSVPIPHFTLFDRTWHLSHNVFADERDLKRTKVTAFARAAFGALVNSGTYSGIDGGSVQMSFLTDGTYNIAHGVHMSRGVAARITMLNNQIDALTESTDYVTIMGDIAKAFGDTILLPRVELTDAITLAYDPITNTQIDNTVLIGAPIAGYDGTATSGITLMPASPWDFHSYAGVIFQGLPIYSTAHTANALPAGWQVPVVNGDSIPFNHVAIDAPVNDPTPEDVFVLTRNAVLCGKGSSDVQIGAVPSGNSAAGTLSHGNMKAVGYTGNSAIYPNAYGLNPSTVLPTKIRPVTCSGSEVFTEVLIIAPTMNTDGSAMWHMVSYDAFNTTLPAGGIALASQFEHAPTFYAYLNSGAQNYLVRCGVCNNITQFKADDLERLHYAALYSEFSI